MVSSHTDIKQLIAENFPPAGAPDVLGTFGDRAARSPIVAAATRDAPADTAATADIVFIEAEGQKVAMIGPVTETERRNTETGLRGQVFDRKRHEEIAEVRSGYVELTGLGAAAEKAKRQRQAEEKRRERAETAMYLAMLQDRINDLDRQIADYGHKIDDFENRHLTPEEKVAINALPEDQRLAAKDAAFRRKVADGTMAQADFDRWTDWYAKRQEAQDQKAELVDVMKNGSDAEVEAAARSRDIRDLEASSADVGGIRGLKVDAIVETRAYTGNVATQDTNVAFSALGNANLFGGATDTSSHASVASKLLPESTLGEGSMIRASDHFGVAAHQTGPSPEAVKVAMDTTTAPDKGPPLPGAGTGPGATV